MQTSKKLARILQNNLWVIILDIIAVNASYYLAFIIRFYLNGKISDAAVGFVPIYFKFAPYYTVLCLAVFAVFRMYNGMWRYAGIDDMNRIIVANIYTALIQIFGTLIFFVRMPLTYYMVGAALQFVFTAMIRFVPRFLLLEKNRLSDQKSKSTRAKAIIIGMNDMGGKTARNLRDTEGFEVTCFLDSQDNLAGRLMDGIPVYGLEKLDTILGNHTVNAVFIADPLLTESQVERIQDACKEVNLIDMTGYLNNQSGSVSLSALLGIANGPVTIDIDSVQTEYPSGKDAIHALRDKYSILHVSAKENRLLIKLKKEDAGTFTGFDEWAKHYKEETGEELSFF